jgi:hypothetical protein
MVRNDLVRAPPIYGFRPYDDLSAGVEEDAQDSPCRRVNVLVMGLKFSRKDDPALFQAIPNYVTLFLAIKPR